MQLEFAGKKTPLTTLECQLDEEEEMKMKIELARAKANRLTMITGAFGVTYFEVFFTRKNQLLCFSLWMSLLLFSLFLSRFLPVMRWASVTASQEAQFHSTRFIVSAMKARSK